MAGWFIGLAAVVFTAYALRYMTSMPGESWRGQLPPPSDEERDLAVRLESHVTAIASGERNVPHYALLEKSAQYLEAELAKSGYRPRPQQFASGGRAVRNIEVEIARTPGGAPTSIVIAGAHYDSVHGAPGANDNGSGVAAVLELARLLRGFSPPSGRALRLALFVNEEPPYFMSNEMGSVVYAREAKARGERIDAMLSLEMLGYYRDAPGSQAYPFPLGLFYPDRADFIAFVGELGARPLVHRALASFRRHARFPSEGVAAPAIVPGVNWSDHWSFTQQAYPAIMVTDTAFYRYAHYHQSSDTPDRLDYARLAKVVLGLAAVMRDLTSDR